MTEKNHEDGWDADADSYRKPIQSFTETGVPHPAKGDQLGLPSVPGLADLPRAVRGMVGEIDAVS